MFIRQNLWVGSLRLITKVASICPLQQNYTAEHAQIAEDALDWPGLPWREVWCHALGRESASLQALDTGGERGKSSLCNSTHLSTRSAALRRQYGNS